MEPAPTDRVVSIVKRWCPMAKEANPRGRPRTPANDNGSHTGEPLDPRILRIAEAIGRQLAREHAKPLPVVNDNEPRRR